MSINDGGVNYLYNAPPGANWSKLKSLTTTIWAYGVPVQPGVFFVQSSGNSPGTSVVLGPCDAAFRPDQFVDALPDDGVMVVSASHNTGGAVTFTRPFTRFEGSSMLPDYALPSMTFPYSQTGVENYSYSGSCTDIYAPGNLILSTWGLHTKLSPTENARSTVSGTLATVVSYSGNVTTPIVYSAHVGGALPTQPPLPTMGWAFLSGSSMAAPFVAAAAAWLADVHGYTTPGELETKVRYYATSVVESGATFPAVPVVRMP